ncbi:BZIP domain-containing protein [Fusarium sp. Ph1]|nr:BZIP domain-containing protein [Fusarium sp. Ph1]
MVSGQDNAQKAYRDRKRQRLQELESKVHALESASFIQLSTPQSIGNLDTTPSQNMDASLGLLGDALNGDSLQTFSNATAGLIEASAWTDADMWLNEVQLDSNIDINNASNDTEELSSLRQNHTPAYTRSTTQHTPYLTTDGKVIQVSRPSGSMMSFSPRVLREFYTSLPKTARDELRELARAGDFSFVDVIKSRLAENNLSNRGPGQRTSGDSTYCPYRNVLHIARFSYFAALFANFSSLGFEFSLFLDEASVSPFVGRSDLVDTDVPSSLRPLPSQRSISHHPYIDSLPFPEFRRRALAALSTDPPLLDEDNLCIDLMLNDGLVCWGSTSENGMDRGTPWDSRSWEAKGWFLRKWWWLVGGQDGELWQSSTWWASQRGEKISTRERNTEGKDIAVGVYVGGTP